MKSRLLGAVCACLLVTSPGIQAVPLDTSYIIDILGFTDTEHTRNDGYRLSDAMYLNDTGQAAGEALRYNGTGTELGQSAWLYNGTSTINIGLTGVEYTRSDGFRESRVSYFNEAGQVAGIAIRYVGSGPDDRGFSSWLYNGTSTINIGMTDAEHTSNDGFQWSVVRVLNDAGQAAGLANRYNGGTTSLGESAWLYNGTNTVNIGLTDTEHTRDDGLKSSRITWGGLNQAGQVLGSSARYVGSDDETGPGRSVWLYNGTSTVNIGLTDAEHTSNNGYRQSFIQLPNSGGLLNEAGHAVGLSQRYNGGEALTFESEQDN